MIGTDFSYTDLLTLLIIEIGGNNLYLENGCCHVVKKSKSESYELLKLMKQTDIIFLHILWLTVCFKTIYHSVYLKFYTILKYTTKNAM